MEFANERPNPEGLFRSVRLCYVFGLSTRERNDMLLLRAPRHCTLAHVERVPGDGVPIKFFAPIRITVCLNDSLPTASPSEPVVFRGQKVRDNSFHSFPVSWSRILYELRQRADSKCSIGSGPSHARLIIDTNNTAQIS